MVTTHWIRKRCAVYVYHDLKINQKGILTKIKVMYHLKTSIKQFHYQVYMPTIETLFFITTCDNGGKNPIITALKNSTVKNQERRISTKEYNANRFSEIASLKVQSQHWVGSRQVSMDVFADNYSKVFKENSEEELTL